jgi:HAD superfamily hydrolase (TIGR01484 family)
LTKLFITDIDGCLMEPMRKPDWDVLSEIKSLNEKSKNDPRIPPLTICTGRPMPYAEAVAQFMGVDLPIVFESAGVFFLDDYRVSFEGAFNSDAERRVDELKKWLKEEIAANFEGMMPEFTKVMDAGLVHPKEEMIMQALPRVEEYVGENYPDFEVHWTDVSINILLKGNNKRTGIRRLCELQQIDPSEAAYIGDSSGDIPGLKIVGQPFAPQNAADAVKEVARLIPRKSTEAVLEAYRLVVQENN